MDSFTLLLRDSGLYGYGILGLGALAAIAGLVSLAGWGTNRRVPPLLMTAPLAVATLLPLLAGGLASNQGLEALASAPPDMRMRLLARSIALLLSLPLLSLLLVGMLVLFILVGGAVAVVRAPRSPVEPIGALMLGIGCVLGGAAAALAAEHLPWRAVFHGLFLLPVVVGLAAQPGSAKQPNAGALCGSAVATAYAVAVIAVELAAIHSDYLLAFMAVANASQEMKGLMLLNGLTYARAGLPFSWLASLAAFGIAIVGVVNASERDRPVQNALLWASLLPVVALLAQLAFDPAGRMLELLVELAS